MAAKGGQVEPAGCLIVRRFVCSLERVIEVEAVHNKGDLVHLVSGRGIKKPPGHDPAGFSDPEG